MKLKQYLSENEISVIDFAKKLKVTRSAVYQFLNGSKTPSPTRQRQIHKITKGEVTPNDLVL